MTLLTPSPSAYEVKPLSPDRAARRNQLIRSLLGTIAKVEDATSLAPGHLGPNIIFKPQNWLAGQMALLRFRIERNQRIERRVRKLGGLRAIDCWEIDQASLAETTAAKLAKYPEKGRAALWTSLAGCDRLLARWAELETDETNPLVTEATVSNQTNPLEEFITTDDDDRWSTPPDRPIGRTRSPATGRAASSGLTLGSV